MPMTYKELRKLFWKVTASIVSDTVKNPNKFVRMDYPTDGQPDWQMEDNIVFLNLMERDDQYGQQYDSEYTTSKDGTVIRHRGRTRVWELLITAYGPDAYEMANKIRDDVLTERVHALLSKNAVFLIPDVPLCRQVPELFAGRWWTRWDLVLHFNEWHEAMPEDVGHIDSAIITGSAHG
jgi:hypothetical protein